MATILDPNLGEQDHEPTRADLIETLAHLCHRAKREMRAVGNDVLPTPWDRRHAAINDCLTDLEELDAK